MGEKIGSNLVLVISSIVGLAILAVLVSKQASTSTVISSAGSALSSVIGSAVAPLSGSSTSATLPNLPSLNL